MSNYYFVPVGQGYMADPRYPPQNWMAQYPPPPQPGHQHYQAVYPTTPVVQDHAQFNTLAQGVYQKVEATQPEPSSTDQQIQQYAQQLHQHSALSAHSNTHIPQHQQNQLSFQQSPFQPTSTSQTSSQQGTPDLTQKANRLRKACDLCSRRKVRCDESGPPCRACIALDIPCTFERPSRRRGPPNRHAEALKRRRLDDSDTLSDYPAPSPPASPTHAAQALAALSSQTSNQQLAAESICPVERIDTLIDDFFTYVHPLYPFPHEPSFREAWSRREDLSSKSFLALLASMVAALVSSYPQKRRLDIDAQTAIDPNPEHVKLARRCQQICIEARGPGYLSSDNLGVYDAATSFFLGLRGLYTSKQRQAKLYLGESLAIVRALDLQQDYNARSVTHSESVRTQQRSCDQIALEISRRIYWALYAITRSNPHIPLGFPELPTRGSAKSGTYAEMPAEVDDFCVYPTHVEAQPQEHVPLMSGFNANIKIYRILDAFLDVESVPAGDTGFDPIEQHRALHAALEECIHMGYTLPPELMTVSSNTQPRITPDSSTAYITSGLRIAEPAVPGSRIYTQHEVQRANIHASLLSTRNDLVMRYNTLLDQQGQYRPSSKSPDRSSSASNINAAGNDRQPSQPTSLKTENLSTIARRQESSFVRDLLDTLGSLLEINVEPNADNFVRRLRTIAESLITRSDHPKSRLLLESRADLAAFNRDLTALESVGITNTSSDADRDGSENRRWQSLRHHQTKLLQWSRGPMSVHDFEH